MTTVLKSLMLAVVLATMGIGTVRAGSEAAAGYYADQKVVYHNGGGGPDGAAYFKRLLANLRNHVEAVGKAHVEIRVVSLGDGVGLFQSAANDKELAGRIDALKGMGVRFLVCANTLRERKVDRTTLYGVGEDDLVPSGVAELARLQGMGFAYIHP
ncbi:DsrE family protein [Methylobacterium sp. A49B]